MYHKKSLVQFVRNVHIRIFFFRLQHANITIYSWLNESASFVRVVKQLALVNYQVHIVYIENLVQEFEH